MILTLDPSLTNTGYAVFSPDRSLLHCDVIKTNKTQIKQKRLSDDRVDRYMYIANFIKTIIKVYHITAIGAECPTGSQNAAAATGIGGVVGIIATTAIWTGLPIEWLTPMEVKKYSVGKNGASKEEMMQWCRDTFPSPLYPKAKSSFEHIADAVAVFHGLSIYGTVIKGALR